MTPEERAAKIIDQYQWDPYAPPYKWLIATEIKAAVKAAVEEARNAGIHEGKIMQLRLFYVLLEKAKAEAFEEAAKIATGVASRVRSFAINEHPEHPGYIEEEDRGSIATAEAIADAIRACSAELKEHK